MHWYTLIFIHLSSADDDKFTATQQNANCVAVHILLPGGVPNMSFKQAVLPLQSLGKKQDIIEKSAIVRLLLHPSFSAPQPEMLQNAYFYYIWQVHKKDMSSVSK